MNNILDALQSIGSAFKYNPELVKVLTDEEIANELLLRTYSDKAKAKKREPVLAAYRSGPREIKETHKDIGFDIQF